MTVSLKFVPICLVLHFVSDDRAICLRHFYRTFLVVPIPHRLLMFNGHVTEERLDLFGATARSHGARSPASREAKFMSWET